VDVRALAEGREGGLYVVLHAVLRRGRPEPGFEGREDLLGLGLVGLKDLNDELAGVRPLDDIYVN